LRRAFSDTDAAFRRSGNLAQREPATTALRA
jgi:hypothetical protein